MVLGGADQIVVVTERGHRVRSRAASATGPEVPQLDFVPLIRHGSTVGRLKENACRLPHSERWDMTFGCVNSIFES